MIKQIMVPVDGSDTAGKALDYAADLARQTDAAITLLSVVDEGLHVTQSIPPMSTPSHLLEPIEDYLRQAAEACLAEAKKVCRSKKVKARGVIRTGYPVEEILKEAKASEADLIVIGSHGRSALAATLLGSVAFGIIHRDTTFPVLVVRR